MLYKIILKNYKSNIRTYILFFVSNILTISILFLFWGINDIIKMSITDRITALTLKTDFSIAASIITIVTAVLLIFSMKYYIQLRSKDYGMYRLYDNNESDVVRKIKYTTLSNQTIHKMAKIFDGVYMISLDKEKDRMFNALITDLSEEENEL